MAFKVKLSKPGYDVKSCDDKDLIFSSDWDTFKIKKVVDFSVDTVAGDGSATVDHDLGYIPLAYGYIKDSSDRWQTDAQWGQWWDILGDCEIGLFTVSVDDDKVYVHVHITAFLGVPPDKTYTGKVILIEQFT
jgi:hypothetical protein